MKPLWKDGIVHGLYLKNTGSSNSDKREMITGKSVPEAISRRDNTQLWGENEEGVGRNTPTPFTTITEPRV